MHLLIRCLVALALVALAGIAGAYVSGYILRLWLGVDVVVAWDTWLAYVRLIDQPAYAPYALAIRVSGGIGFGAALLCIVPFIAVAFRGTPKTLHGDARFARRTDLARHGLLKSSPTGIVVGRWGRSLIRLPGQQFVILAAPTRSGKGVGVVIPNLLSYDESMVVLDIKQENFDLTSGWRKAQGQEIFLFNPFAEDRRTHRWNPLGYVSADPAFRISDLQAISAMLYPDAQGEQNFWVSQARNAFVAFTLYAFEKRDQLAGVEHDPMAEGLPTLGKIFALSTGKGTDLKTYLRGLASEPFLSANARSAFGNLLSQADDTFSSIMGSFREPLNAFLNPVLDAATSHNDFLLTDVRRKRMTIYIGIQPNKLAESRVLVNLFFSQLINVNTKTLPQSDDTLKHQCLMLMDEFTSIGRVDILARAVSYMAGYNMRLLPIIQSMAQLDSVYGRELARTLVTNHALQIIYAPREQQDANDYSDMLGYTTVRQTSTTRGRDVSRSESQERRALMLPQELKAMGFDKEVFLYEGIPHPVMCQKIKYYEEKVFKRRLLEKVVVEEINVIIDSAKMRRKVDVLVSESAMKFLVAA
jgi:type IV secretion system protein VirD4